VLGFSLPLKLPTLATFGVEDGAPGVVLRPYEGDLSTLIVKPEHPKPQVDSSIRLTYFLF
jgi:hypothetical protein